MRAIDADGFLLKLQDWCNDRQSRFPEEKERIEYMGSVVYLLVATMPTLTLGEIINRVYCVTKAERGAGEKAFQEERKKWRKNKKEPG